MGCIILQSQPVKKKSTPPLLPYFVTINSDTSFFFFFFLQENSLKVIKNAKRPPILMQRKRKLWMIWRRTGKKFEGRKVRGVKLFIKNTIQLIFIQFFLSSKNRLEMDLKTSFLPTRIMESFLVMISLKMMN